jgi:hypothetical protein
MQCTVYSGILSKNCAIHKNAWVPPLNGGALKEDGGGTMLFNKDNSVVALDILKCM